ncbi:50S ribosomal protein L24 [Candidatus Falkowbacteria bacterium CG_4_10_14_0_2_um_filter_41_15]|uniref:Large ribosomal subunit protein uL24 n=4 Tax=Candidatus Falkowiibacteriota TaxID=1752728 RepID=A0A2G9ZM91_9BACT|nr:MAG: 50S ribosomal protein L24 [Candidatus Falkowbacteria bacterium CG1_02_41_21]PIP34296.1 MAG: 50S ribosomal protein L24 [Candidatus Falkowbacteria bacterium CG23_combo_of_CG06-09_8_20_14_all_41_10]PIZ10740.1 MAG: 50S ribosomal protein L24 [Candidatus Falkowbacteria bacterium CG_4_10_14_0_8_um_filter_41_36]PJA10071.1 MAG: 50S ribosomal protein L24 [Candidatus Falkowbacteria bacterium CG_4_10_14_0_2_um_filter_41_15]
MNIKKEDKVKILTGKDKGKSGKVLQVLPARGKVSVEGLNLLIKHMRPSKKGEKGQRIEFPAFVDASNLAVVCPKCGKTTRMAYKIAQDEGTKKSRKHRICKKCQEAID